MNTADLVSELRQEETQIQEVKQFVVNAMKEIESSCKQMQS